MWNAAVPSEPSANSEDPEVPNDSFDEVAAFIPTQAGTTEAPLCDQANVDKQAAEWGNLWETKQTYVEPMLDLQLDMFQGLASSVIPLAASTFPADTGLSADGTQSVHEAVRRIHFCAGGALRRL